MRSRLMSETDESAEPAGHDPDFRGDGYSRPHCQESCHPSQSQTRGLDGAEQCVVTARRSRLMSEGG